MLARLAYSSRSLIGGWSPELLDIARAAFSRNAALGLTGVLYFDRLRFFQVLEGRETAVSEVMRSIAVDSRHFDLRLIIDTPVERRRFGLWSMRFIDGSAERDLAAAFPEAEPSRDAAALADRAAHFVDVLARF